MDSRQGRASTPNVRRQAAKLSGRLLFDPELDRRQRDLDEARETDAFAEVAQLQSAIDVEGSGFGVRYGLT